MNYANGAAALLFLAVPPLAALAAAEPLRPLVRAPLGALAALVLALGATPRAAAARWRSSSGSPQCRSWPATAVAPG